MIFQSFVENVTSRVSGLFPSTISKWFGASTSSNANGSTLTAESTDSSTEDEATESSIPTAKRMRYMSPGKTVYYSSVHVSTILMSLYLDASKFKVKRAYIDTRLS